MKTKSHNCTSRLLSGAPACLLGDRERVAMACQRRSDLPISADTLHIFTIFAEMAFGTRTAAAWWMLQR